VTVTVALLLRPPAVPVTVNVNVPSAVMLVADRVKRLVLVAGFVPKVALTPLGKPDAAKFTLLLNPFRGLILIVVEPPAF
jgi:hypothetical protein